MRWSEFQENPDLRDLYDVDAGGPVGLQIEALRKAIENVELTDPLVLATKKGQLWGLLAVRQAVEALAVREQQQHLEELREAAARLPLPADSPFPRTM